MGTVYLAEDRTKGNARCVVKQLNNKYSDPAERAEAIRLFQREAAILRNLSHPGIVHIFDDHATEDGRYFLVMDYVPGKNLEVMLNTGGPFDPQMTVHMGIQCCKVLEYLHKRSPPVIYRDLKPSNLMLTPTGDVVFVDFGIARVFMPADAATRVVTAGYSPPEQYFGKPETRSDLYALGATLSHLLTGKRPKPLNPSVPGTLSSGIPEPLSDLCRRLTAHSPEDRPATANAVRHELYKIYKVLYPDFEIPAEPEPSQSLESLKICLEKPASLKNVLPASIGTSTGTGSGTFTLTGKVNLERQRASLAAAWQWIKQWFQIWMS
ncbi:MAG: serine/threonine protein kinase [Candidatus Melainabacteria bacterium]|nr:serine/threonine protein kinase [Candidatus Melainabacteria bacterium]